MIDQERHQRAPQQAAVDAGKVKRQPAERTLHYGDHHRALDGGAGDGGELHEQVVLHVLGERQRFERQVYQIGAVFQQEEQQVEHYAETDDEVEGALADQEHAARQVLPTFERHLGKLLLDLGGAVEVMLRQEALRPAGQVAHKVRQHGRQLAVVGLQLGVDHVEFHRQRRGDDRQWREHDQADQRQRQQRHHAVAFADVLLQLLFHRMENHRQNNRPQHRGVVRPQHVEKGGGDDKQDQDKESFGNAFRHHSRPSKDEFSA